MKRYLMIIYGMIITVLLFGCGVHAGMSGETDAAAESIEARSCLLYTSPSPRDRTRSRMPSSA